MTRRGLLLVFALALGCGEQEEVQTDAVDDLGELLVERQALSTEGPSFPHQRIAYFAVDALPEEIRPEFLQNRGGLTRTCSDPDTYFCLLTNQYLTAGADEADQWGWKTGYYQLPIPKMPAQPGTDELTFFAHFWDPDLGWNVGLSYLGSTYTSAFHKALIYWRWAVSFYRAGTPTGKRLGYYWLGHVAHLLADAGVPAHVLLDPHPTYDPDGYEKYSTEEFWKHAEWQQGVFINPSELPYTPTGCGTDYNSIAGTLGLTAGETILFRLFVNLAEHADNYDSVDVDMIGSGNVDKSCGGVGEVCVHRSSFTSDEEYLQAMAADLLPTTVSYTSALYRLFWAVTHEADGGPVCGDGVCVQAESCLCPADCGDCATDCGDGFCGTGESCGSCPQDCGVCQPMCGDGSCDAGETCVGCPSDCTSCASSCTLAARTAHTATLLTDGSILLIGGSSPVGAQQILQDGATVKCLGAPLVQRQNHSSVLLSDGRVLVTGGQSAGVTRGSTEFYLPGSRTFVAGPDMGVARESHSATLLRDGRVLLVGGLRDYSTYLASAELFDPESASFTSAGSLTTARAGHTATLLPSGDVLVCGGRDSSGALPSCERFDHSTATWSTVAAMAGKRNAHTATLLPDGRVLVAGGVDGAALATAELYDDALDIWTPASSLSKGRYVHSAVLAPWGGVLVLGGYDGSSAVAGVELYYPNLDRWILASNLTTARYQHTATLLASGQVAVMGGTTGTTAVGAVELVSIPAETQGLWVLSAPSPVKRRNHTSTLLQDGRVLVVAGYDGSNYLSSATLFDPSSGLWSSAGNLTTARTSHAATLLPSGKVLVSGGGNSSGYQSSCELYDPATNSWSVTGNLKESRDTHLSVLLANGKVLVTGGRCSGYYCRRSSSELYDPASGTWSYTGSLHTERTSFAATQLADGRIMVAGGRSFEDWLESTVEIYDPTTGTWTSAANMISGRTTFSLVLLNDGRVLAATGSNGSPIFNSEVYSPTTNSWSPVAPPNSKRSSYRARLLSDGKVLLIGGYNGSTAMSSCEIYDPVQDSWVYTGSMNIPRVLYQLTTLFDGRQMVLQGYDSGSAVYDSAELYYHAPALNVRAAAPVLGALSPATAVPGQTVLLAGAGFRGASAGGGGGTQDSPSDHPVVSLTSGSAVYYLTSSGWNQGATAVVLPCEVSPGTYKVRAYVHGTPTNELTLTIARAGEGDACWCNAACQGLAPNDCHGSVGTCTNGVCVYPHSTHGASCNDGDNCSSGDHCDGTGSCVATPYSCVADQCQVSSVCNGAGGCTVVYKDPTTSCDDGKACTLNDVCGASHVCAGVAKVCSTPPIAECQGPASSRVYSSQGVCSNADGECHYSFVDIACGGACGGTCSPITGLCSGESCCGVVCDAPPSSCFQPLGSCLNGSCSYAQRSAGSSCDDGNPCTAGDKCDVAGICEGVVVAAGTACSDGQLCTYDDTCTPDGRCIGSAYTCRGPLTCEDDVLCDGVGGCLPLVSPPNRLCDDGNPCTSGDHCDGTVGLCAGAPYICSLGACDSSATCNGDGTCAYVPSNGAACDDGNVCTIGDLCSERNCVPGTGTRNCDDGNACTTDSCDAVYGCVNVPNHSPCDDGNACTVGDTCSNGGCLSGPPLSCDDGDVCTSDSCNAATGCLHSANNLPCDDNNACTTGEACSNKACVGGVQVECSDGNPCTDEACNPATGCGIVANSASCDDKNECTLNDYCSNGVCVGGQALNCNDNNPCTYDACSPTSGCLHTANSAVCDDGNACTVGDACANKVCVSGLAANCSDANVCTDDSCNTITGCVHTTNAVPCDDANACTTGDVCVEGGCHGASTWPSDCDDQNPCTSDSCIPASGCVHQPVSGSCDDGHPETGLDHCLGGECVGVACDCGEPGACCDGCFALNDSGDCDDGDPCTLGDACGGGFCQSGKPRLCEQAGPCKEVGFCDPESGLCTYENKQDGTVCDDANPLSGGDHCVNGMCVAEQCTCSGVNQCCDGCLPRDDSQVCDDGNACTTVDTCLSGACVGTLPVVCQAQDDCHGASQCDPESGSCTAPVLPDGTPCDADGNGCTQSDACVNGLCVAGTPVSCSDLDTQCSSASCVSTGVAQYDCLVETQSLEGATCDDGNACSDVQVCTLGTCTAVHLLECVAFDQCHAEGECDPATGLCSEPLVPDGTGCDDGSLCTTDDRCLEGVCLGKAMSADACDDQNVCTMDFCSADEGCKHDYSTMPCDDGDACTSDDSCVQGSCVGAAVPPGACDDQNVCTDDSCDPAAGCLHLPNSASCDDDDVCTQTACQGGLCIVVETLAGCCHSHLDCDAPEEMCEPDAHACLAVPCLACESDSDCGYPGNRCRALFSGSYCMVPCDPDSLACPQDQKCDYESNLCVPRAGDCLCVTQADIACLDGSLFHVDSCGAKEELVEDCDGRGCSKTSCCPEGTHGVDGICESNVVDDPKPDAVLEPSEQESSVEAWDAAVAEELAVGSDLTDGNDTVVPLDSSHGDASGSCSVTFSTQAGPSLLALVSLLTCLLGFARLRSHFPRRRV